LGEQAPLRIVAFGSSSTEGVGASSAAAAYPSRLERDLSALFPEAKIEVLNRGIGGEDADDMSRRLPSILAEKPDLVIWQTGSNDPLRDVPVDRFIEETRSGIAAMQSAGIDVMLMEPQYCRKLASKPGSERFRDAVRSIGTEMGVPVIRRYDLMQSWVTHGLVTLAKMLSIDGMHMADAGYALLATDVAHQIAALTKNSPGFGTAQR
jgi:lysophospholipase L1-like esterase